MLVDRRATPCDNSPVSVRSPYRAASPGVLRRCPLCELDLDEGSSICTTCGLSWAAPDANERAVRPSGDPGIGPPITHLVLPRPLSIGIDLFVLVLAVFVIGSAVVIASSRHIYSGFFEVALALLAFPVSLWVGFFMIIWTLQAILQRLVPSRLEFDESSLRVRIWRDGPRTFARFLRTDVRIPREHIKGAVLTLDQAGHSCLRLVHLSGVAFDTGWSGPTSDAQRLGTTILRQLSRRTHRS